VRSSDEVVMVATRRSIAAPRPYSGRSATDRNAIEVVNPPDLTSIVFVVDDDISVRESLELLIRSAGWRAETFESGQDFLSRPSVSVPCCLLLDVSLPGLKVDRGVGSRE
jgi:PleD family two-component response regulator